MQIEKTNKQTNMADREIGILCANEDEKVSDENKLSLYEALEAYPCLWERSNLNHKNRERHKLKEIATRISWPL